MRHRAPQSGEVERLGRRRQRDGAGGGVLVERGERDVAVRFVGQLGVDLVAEHEQVVAPRDRRDLGELVPREDPPGRVVWVDQQEHPAVVRGHGVGEAREVGRPARGRPGPRRVDSATSHGLEGGEEGRVVGGLQGHRVAGIRRQMEHELEGLEEIGVLTDVIRRYRPAVPLLHPVGEGRPERVAVLPARVGEITAADGVLDRVGHHRRHGEVHVRDPRRKDVRIDPLPLHAGPSAQLVQAQVVEQRVDGPERVGPAHCAAPCRSRSRISCTWP